MNLKIKSIRGDYATTKVQLLDPDTQVKPLNEILDEDGKPRKTVTARERGYRPIEPGEVVEMPDDQAKALMKIAGDVLEMTDDSPTRPLFFDEIDQNEAIGLARATSASFNVSDEGREQEQTKAKAKVKDKMSKKRAANPK